MKNCVKIRLSLKRKEEEKTVFKLFTDWRMESHDYARYILKLLLKI